MISMVIHSARFTMVCEKDPACQIMRVYRKTRLRAD
jgi:hypothetical protein